MREWPKKLLHLSGNRWWLEADKETEPVPPDLNAEMHEVIPYDLGQEAIKVVRGALEDNPLDDRPWTYDARRFLARYEQEVGK